MGLHMPLIPGILSKSSVLPFNNLSTSAKSLFPKFIQFWNLHNSRWSTESSQVLTVPKQLPTPLCFLSLTFHFFNSVLGNTENKVGEGDVQAFLLTILLNTHYIKLDFAHKTLVELEFN